MINREEFEFHKSIADWMMDKGTPFMEAMSVISYAHQMNISIPVFYFDLNFPNWKIKEEIKEEIKNV